MRMLFLTDAYLQNRTLDHFRAAVLKAFEDAGAKIELVIANRYIDNASWSFLSREAEREFYRKVNARSWDFVFNFNRAGMTEGVSCTNDSTPVLTWFIDSPERVPAALRKHKREEQVFIPDDSYLDSLSCQEGLEPRRVHYLPFAAPPEMVQADDPDPELMRQYEAEISFVGTLFNMRPLAALLAGANKETSRKLIALARDHFADYHVPIRALLDKHDLHLRAIPGIQESVETFLLRAIDDYQSSIIRLDCLDAVADLGLRIYGNSAWAETAIRSLALLDCFEFREARPEELGLIYRASRISLNICHSQARAGLPLRVFDIVGCGAFLLSERRSDLTRLFREDRELVVFDNPKELREKAEHFLANDGERRAIAEAGRCTVLKKHMISHRVQSMLETLR